MPPNKKHFCNVCAPDIANQWSIEDMGCNFCRYTQVKHERVKLLARDDDQERVKIRVQSMVVRQHYWLLPELPGAIQVASDAMTERRRDDVLLALGEVLYTDDLQIVMRLYDQGMTRLVIAED